MIRPLLALLVLFPACHLRLQKELPRVERFQVRVMDPSGAPAAPGSLEEAFQRGLERELTGGTGTEPAHSLACVMDDHGLDVLSTGSAPDLYVHLRCRLRDPEGRRIWNDETTCRAPLLQFVDDGGKVTGAGDWPQEAQIQQAVLAMAEACGPWLADRMRKQGAP